MQGNLSEIGVIIEIPKGCRNKYEHDPERKLFRLDHKILCVPTKDPEWNSMHKLRDVSPHLLIEILHFFNIYKELEGKESMPEGWEDVDSAMSIIDQARERYARNKMAGNR